MAIDITTIGVGMETSGLVKGQAELGKTEQAANRTADAADKLTGRMTATDRAMKSLTDVTSLAAKALGGFSAAMVIGKIVSVQREIDVLSSSLKTVTGSSAAAEKEMAWLKTFAKDTPFGLAQATQGFVKMKALGLDPTMATLTSFGNTASAMGKNLNQMIEAVADASTSEFERLKEFGVKAKQEGDKVSLTFQGVTTKIGNNAGEIVSYLEKIGNTQFAGAMEDRAKTLDGTIAALGDTWDELFRTISTNNAGSLIFDSVVLANGAIEDAIVLLDAMSGAAEKNGRATGAMATIQSGIATVFETVAVLGVNLKYVLVGIGDEIGGLAAQVAAAARFDFSGVKAIRASMLENAAAARADVDATSARILNARRLNEIAKTGEGVTDALTRKLEVHTVAQTRSAGATTKNAAASQALARELKEQYKVIAELAGLSGSFAEDWDRLNKMFAAGKLSVEQLTKAQADLLAKQPAIKEATDAQAKALQENAAAHERMREALNADVAVSEKAAASLTDQNKTLREEIELIGLSEAAQHAITQARGEAIILIKEQELATITAADNELETMSRRQIALAAEIEQLRERNQLTGAKFDKTTVAKVADDANKEWSKFTDDIEKGLTDSLYRGFEAGKGFFKSFWDGIKNLFKTTVLKLAVQGVMTGVTGTASGLANAAGGGGGIGGLLGNVGGLFGGGSAGGILDLLGSTGLGALDFGGISLAGLSSGAGMLAKAIPYVGWAVAAVTAITALVKKFDTSGTPHVGQLAEYSAAGGLKTSQKHGDFGMGFGGVDYNEGAATLVQGVSKTIVSILDSTATAFGKAAGYSVATGFADDSSKDGAWGGLLIKQMENVLVNWDDTRSSKWAPKVFADGEAGQKEYLAALAKDVTGVLKEMDLPGWAQDTLTALGETPSLESLATAIDQINATKAALDVMGKNLVGFAGYSDAATSKLIKASGGIANLASNAAAYYQAYYTEDERRAHATRDVTEALAAVNVELPANEAAYRALVEQFTAMGDAGADTLAVLLRNALAFKEITPAGEAAAETVEQLMAKLRNPKRSAEDIARNTIGLEDKLFQTENKGNIAALRERELRGLTDSEKAIQQLIWAREDEAVRASERAGIERDILSLQGDTAALRALDLAGLDAANRALKEHYYALVDEAAAAEKAAQVKAEGQSIERDILSLQGDTAALRALELAGLDPANRALKEHYYALLDEKNAAEAAAAAVRAAANEHAGLQERLWQIEGNTGALREAALKKLLDDESRDLQRRIWAAEDEADARQKAAAAAQAAASAAAQWAQDQAAAAKAVRDAWTSVGETILDEVKRLRGEVTGGSPQSMAQAQAAFAIATAQARAGDQDAAKQLPSLSKALEDIAKKDAASSLELWRVQTATAASLEMTAKMLADKFGFTLPSFAVGTNYVPQDMVAQIHKGEAIVPAAFNPMLTGGSNNSGNAELVAEVRALRQQVAELQATADKTERNTKRASDDLDDFSRNGMPTINQPGTTLATV